MTNAVISGDFHVSTGQQNYSKKFTGDGRTSFAYHLHNPHYH